MSKMRTPTESFRADRVAHALRAAVESTTCLLHRHEHQVLVNREIALTTGTDERGAELRRARVGDVPDLEAVESALVGVIPHEGQICIEKREIGRILCVGEVLWPCGVTDEHEVSGGLAGIAQPGTQANARVTGRNCAVALGNRASGHYQ